MEVRFNVKDRETLLQKHGLQPGGPVQKLVDSECMRYMGDYMPRIQKGHLEHGMKIATVAGSGVIEVPGPDAHYLHEGILYVSPTTKRAWAKLYEIKVPAKPEKELTYFGAPMRGKKFFDRMKADHKDDVLRSAQALVDKGGKA